jgi:hypothetical protein
MAGGSSGFAVCSVTELILPTDHHIQTGDAAVPHDDLAAQRVDHDRQVLARPDRFQVCAGGALTAGVLMRDVVPADALLDRAVEVGNERHPELLSRAYERLAQRIVLDLLGDVHRTHAADSDR